MNNFLNIIAIFLIALSISISSFEISPRIKDGINVDTLKRFPHHVTIHPRHKSDAFDNGSVCSGSIISNRWILTALNCVNKGTEYRIDFKRLFLNDTIDSFSIIFDQSSVIRYPTNFDDIALIYLPIILEFSEYIQPVILKAINDNSEDDKFAVMAGFGKDESKLTYGMYETYACHDKYLQLCTNGWMGKDNYYPTDGNIGGGLIMNWPEKPILIGIFSYSPKYPRIFVRVGQYYPWIKSVTNIGDDSKPEPTKPYPTNTDPTSTYPGWADDEN